jgi:hypothetical protein
MNLRASILFASLMVAALAYSQPAAARTFTVPAGSTSNSGMIFGDAFTAMQAPGGACTFQILGLGGMTENATQNGTNSSERMFVVTSSITFCGFTMSPLVTNGFTLQFNGNAGNDNLLGFTKASVNGGAGDDIIRSEKVGSSIIGGPGSDLIATSTNTIVMRGGTDTSVTHNDAFCVFAPATTVNFMDGDQGTNTRCGNAELVLNVQSQTCVPCGF